jgi:acyl-CoA synthetase (AMP-forming)/AMP-acid ligase II
MVQREMKRRVQTEGLLWRHWERLHKRRPKQVVLIDALRDASWTTEELTAQALAFADRLGGFRPGARIAFRAPNGPEWMALFLAVQRAGLAAVPLDGALPAEGCADVARQLQADALYLDSQFHSLAKTGRTTRCCCCVKVTSGSAGLPKAVPCQAEHLLADGRQIVATMGIRPGDRNLAAIPLGHSYGLGNLVMPLLLQGTAMVTTGEYVPRQLLEWVGQYRVTVLPLVPALFRVLAALPPGPDLAPVRTAISAGAILSPATAQAFFERYGIKVHNFYGSSETGGICYDRTGSASLSGRSVGRPLVGVSLALRNGRVTVESSAVATRSGRWTLNDCGEWNGRGELVLLGRLGQGANIGGKKVHPLEVERALRELPEVTDATVWRTRNGGRDFLAAGVETKLGQTEIERALARRLPAWKLPKAYLIAPELPRTARGKLDHAALRRRVGEA